MTAVRKEIKTGINYLSVHGKNSYGARKLPLSSSLSLLSVCVGVARTHARMLLEAQRPLVTPALCMLIPGRPVLGVCWLSPQRR